MVSPRIINDTFEHFRRCGNGRRECQVLWVGPWAEPMSADRVVHPRHRAYGDGFELDVSWLNAFWASLADEARGVRVQVHTHPREAFHSPTDDEWPIVHVPGFLSLVIPDFGMGPVSLQGAYLTEIQPDGSWAEVSIHSRLRFA